MGLREIGCEGAYWTHLAQDRVQWWAVMNKVIQLQAGNFLTM
jgi:hypothetical protein